MASASRFRSNCPFGRCRFRPVRSVRGSAAFPEQSSHCCSDRACAQLVLSSLCVRNLHRQGKDVFHLQRSPSYVSGGYNKPYQSVSLGEVVLGSSTLQFFFSFYRQGSV
ncbi:hypothetical protein NDU88_007253 [Pleurodeles waltl]|uniref:Uncharacterized protein n=1 Tax=Pleurodeles waltl TaxID=8319 RepID=A0AAV7RPR3_PLEWA|nr:hypothetical protein NDU88_007253 [Pleurodeles waltl]